MKYVFDPKKTLIGHQIPQVMARLLAVTRQCTQQLKYSSPLWKELARQVKMRDGWRCRDCGDNRNLDVHHVVPIRSGGTNLPDNLRTLCRKCHRIRTFGGQKPRGNTWPRKETE